MLVNVCGDIPLATYTPTENEQVAQEIEAAPAGAFWPRMIEDYGRQRAAIRACRNAPVK